MHGKQPGDALDHHLTRLVFGFPDKRDARGGIAKRELTHPFGAGAGLTGAAAAENEPGGPGFAAVRAFGRTLMVVSEAEKIGKEIVTIPVRHPRQKFGRHCRFDRAVEHR